jgi:DNA-binding NarL/FixJ family response regulator
MVNSGTAGASEGAPQIDLTNRGNRDPQRRRQGYKRREIGEKLGISTGTVGNHINNIYQKLNVNSNTEAIARATRMGLL